MADGTFLITLSPDTAYATRKNLLYPGTQAQADAAETRADSRIEDSLPSGVTISGLAITANDE
jgi:hypothetical protein